MSDSQSNSANTDPPSGEPVTAVLRYREAYQQILGDRLAIDSTKLLVINVDVPTSYMTVVDALPRIMALRELATRLPGFELKNFDNLETYALALMHTHGEYVSASAPPDTLIALNDEGVALRDNLHSDALALANRGVIDGEPLKAFKTAVGYRNLAEDLIGLSTLLRRSWGKIDARTVITLAELDRAEALSEQLLHALALRQNASSVLADAIRKRLQVFTLLANAYDQVRRAISFLRWQEDDIEQIAPSLYAGRRRRKLTSARIIRAAP